jgi:hypothetical protein
MQVGKVAAPAAGDQNLFADALGPLQHGHAASALAGFNGAHQAGRAAAENDYIETLHKKGKKPFTAKGAKGARQAENLRYDP